MKSEIQNPKSEISDEMLYFLDRFLLGMQRHWRVLKWEPLRIVFTMSSPIALCHPWMHLDGLIGHLSMINALGEDYYLLPKKFPFSRMLRAVPNLPPLPIKHTKGLYHSSVSIFDTDRKALEILYKKFEDRWAGGKKKIEKGSGYFKDYMIQHVYIPARTVTFYVRGDKELLTQLLDRVVSLGDNTRVGWGAVRQYEVTSIPRDISIIQDGKAMRPIPEHLLASASEKVALAWKPPYWAPETVAICAPPGAEVRLK